MRLKIYTALHYKRAFFERSGNQKKRAKIKIFLQSDTKEIVCIFINSSCMLINILINRYLSSLGKRGSILNIIVWSMPSFGVE